MKKNTRFILPCFLFFSAVLGLTACAKKETPPDETPEVPVTTQTVKCKDFGFDEEACVKENTTCEFLPYPEGGAKKGKCVAKERPKDCTLISPEDCTLIGIVPPPATCVIEAGDCVKYEKPDEKNVDELFALTDFTGKNAAQIDSALQDIGVYFAKLKPEKRKEFAKKGVLNRLVAVPQRKSVVDFEVELFKDLADADATDVVNKDEAGVTPIQKLTGPRPLGDSADHLERAIRLLAERKANLKGLGRDNVYAFFKRARFADLDQIKKVYEDVNKSEVPVVEDFAKYVIEQDSPAAKQAFSRAYTEGDAGQKLRLKNALVTEAVKADMAAAPGAPRTKLIGIVNNDGTWFGAGIDWTLPDFSIDGAPVGANPQGKVIAAIASGLKKLAGATAAAGLPANSKEVTYLSQLVPVFAVKIPTWNTFKDPALLAAMAPSLAGANDPDKQFLAQTILGEDIVTPVWETIIAQANDLAVVGTRAQAETNITAALKRLADIDNPVLRTRKFVELARKRVGNPAPATAVANYRDLQLSHIILRNTLSAKSAEWITTIVDNLPEVADATGGPAVSKTLFFQQAAGANPAQPLILGPANQWAIADFFLGRGAEVVGQPYKDIAQKISTLPTLPDVTNPQSVGPKLATAVIKDWSNAAVRAVALAMLQRVTDLAAAPPTADALRKAVIAFLVTQSRGNQNVIHKMFKNGIDVPLQEAFSRMLADLGGNATPWIALVDPTAAPANSTVLKDLLLRPLGMSVPDVVAPVEQLPLILAKVGAVPTLTPNTANAVDVTVLWAALREQNFATAQRNAAMAVLNRIVDLGNDSSLRNGVMRGLVGDGDGSGAGGGLMAPLYPANFIAAPNTDPLTGVVHAQAGQPIPMAGAGLIQGMLSGGVVDAPLVNVYKSALAAQDTPERKRQMLDQALGGVGKPMALTELADGGGGVGSNLTVPPDAQKLTLLRLFIGNGALAALNGANYNQGRSNAIFDFLLPGTAVAGNTDFSDLYPGLDNGNKNAFSRWALNNAANVTRAPAVKQIMDAPKVVADADTLMSKMFAVALNSDIDTVVRVLDPGAKDSANPLSWKSVYEAIPLVGGTPLSLMAFLRTNLAAYGLTIDDIISNDYVFGANTGPLLWLLLEVANANFGATAMGLAANVERARKEALVRSIARKVREMAGLKTDDAGWKAFINPNIARYLSTVRLPNLLPTLTDDQVKALLYVN